MPTSVEHKNKINEKNGNQAWKYAIDKEMKNVAIDFDIIDRGKTTPVGWNQYRGQIFFDVKMYFTRKEWLVNNRHKNPNTNYSALSGLVSR